MYLNAQRMGRVFWTLSLRKIVAVSGLEHGRHVSYQLYPKLINKGCFSASKGAQSQWDLGLSCRNFGSSAFSYQSSSEQELEEVEFSPMLANSINIIGNVGKKPEIKYLESGSKVSNFPVAFSDRKDGETQWFDVEAWDQLAELVCSSVDKGERVSLHGRLKVQDWTDREGNQRKSLRIVAASVKRVRKASMYGGNTPRSNEQGMFAQTEPQVFQSKQQSMIQQEPPQGSPSTSEEMWMSFFENTSGWYDNRQKKINGEINPKSPDFKRIEGGRDAPALWIESKTTPAWVRNELEKMDRLASDIPPF